MRIVIFLLVVLGIYGLMHGYVLWRLLAAFPALRRPMWPWAVAMAVLLLSPIWIRLIEGRIWRPAAEGLALVGYMWMVVVFWAVLVLLAAQVWNLSVSGIAHVAPAMRRAVLPGSWAFAILGIWVAVAFAWGWAEASRIRIRPVVVEVPHLPEGRGSLTIALITDVHLGVHTGWRRWNRAIALIHQAQPDVLVSTGDLLDSSHHHVDGFAGPLAAMEPPLGKFAVLGNHEFYNGVGISMAFHQQAGLRVLRAERVEILPGVWIAGVDDPAVYRFDGSAVTADEDRALPPPGEGVVVLLKHQPIIEPESVGRFRLQLSGHSHGGQVFPFNIATRLRYGRYHRGLHELGQGSAIYTSPGTGTWGPRLRVLAPPEVTLITLRPASP